MKTQLKVGTGLTRLHTLGIGDAHDSGFVGGILPRFQVWAVPLLCLALAGVASAQSASDFGTVQTGAKAVVNLIRIIGGVVGVGALVFATFRLYGGDMVRGLTGVFGGILALLIAANAQSIVNGFYSTSGIVLLSF